MRTDLSRNGGGLSWALVVMAAIGAGGVAAEDWPNLRGPNQNGAISGTGALSADEFGLEVEWDRPLGSGYSGIAVVGDRLVTLFSDGDHDLVVALDRDTGDELWRHEIETTYKGHDGSDDGPTATPMIDGDTVFALGPKGQLVALRLSDGTELWRVGLETALEAKPPRYGFATTPLVVGEVLFVQTGGPDGRAFTGFDKRTGAVLWSAGDAEVAYQSPVAVTLAGRLQVVAVGNKTVTGIDPKSGEILWSHAFSDQQGEGATNPVVVEGDRVLLTSDQDAVLLRVTADEGSFGVEEVWRERTFKGTLAAPVYLDGYFYGFDGNFLTCVDAATGAKQWKSRPPGGHGLILVDDRLVVYNPDGDLVVARASPEGYDELVRLKASERGGYTWPSFADGTFFVRNLDRIVRVRIGEPLAPVAVAELAPPANRFEAFVREVQASSNKRALIDDFMNAQPRLPIVDEGFVHFVYRGDVEDVAITGSMTEYQSEEALERIEGTDLFHRSYAIEPGARWEYRFNVDFENLGPDPANPRRVPGAQGDSSEVLAPGYHPPDFVRAYHGDAPGRLETFTFASEILGNEREVTVYLPAGYDGQTRSYPLLVFTAGEAWLNWGNTPNALDNLIGKTIEPIVAVFVSDVPQATREEMTGAKAGDYVRMLADELLPHLASSYRVATEPQSRAITGYATAAAVTARAALERPDAFGLAAIQSAYLPGSSGDDLAEVAREHEDSRGRFLVYWNRYELRREDWSLDLAADSRRLAEILRTSGHEVNDVEVLDSAGWGSWRARMGEILVAFAPSR